MAKSSGGTRTLRNATSSSIPDYEKLNNDLLDYIQDPYKNYDKWNRDYWDELSEGQRELALMQAGFTGLMSDTELEAGTLYYAEKRERLVAELADDLGNVVGGYGIDGSVTWTIGMKDGSILRLDQFEDLPNNLGVTNRQTYKGQQSRVNSALGKANFVIRTDGYEQPRYWVNRGGMDALKKYGGFEEWKNGRGEKQRSYIQDDWI